MKILHLTLKKKWFDMIASGEKKEEYRELKTYWVRRLTDCRLFHSGQDFTEWLKVPPDNITADHVLKHFDAVIFKNGYSVAAPTKTFRVEGIEIGEGKQEWGAEAGKKYFVIKLGKKI